jgi:hypothetical protein
MEPKTDRELRLMKITGPVVIIGGKQWCSLAIAAEQTGLSRITIRERIIEGIIEGYFLKSGCWIVNLDSALENNQYKWKQAPETKDFTA